MPASKVFDGEPVALPITRTDVNAAASAIDAAELPD